MEPLTQGLAHPEVLATVGGPGQIATGTFTNDGSTDTFVAVTDTGGVTVIYGQPLTLPANNTAATARNLGSTGHLVTLPQAIVTGTDDNAYFTYTVPTYAGTALPDEVIDFSASFPDTGETWPGDRRFGRQRCSHATGFYNDGRRRALPGDGPAGRHADHRGQKWLSPVTGYGAYSLDVDVLPQVVSVQAESALPGAPATSLVLTLQGDNLDTAAAENPANYTITWLGPDGVLDGTGNEVIPVAADSGGQPVIYDPGADLGVASGLDYPTASRQTITLLFTAPLPVGSYEISLSPNIQTASFNSDEANSLVGDSSFEGHPMTTVTDGSVVGIGQISFRASNLVSPDGTPNPNAIAAGTPFLTPAAGQPRTLWWTTC